MCIGFPGKIISIDKDNYAVIDISGTRREVCLDIVDEPAGVGDYVISHAGYAIHKIDVETAKEKLKFLQELIDNEIY
ncbi:MAG TPA: HypC/HybG/HupF family hydrogenase formation chaperone [Smithella sp.]|nr:HypC/HybG/HupF family hydrogenase formation chaperone [Smithella sp.]